MSVRRITRTGAPQSAPTGQVHAAGCVNDSCPFCKAPALPMKMFELTVRVGVPPGALSANAITPGVLAHAVKIALEEAGMTVPELGCMEVPE